VKKPRKVTYKDLFKIKRPVLIDVKYYDDKGRRMEHADRLRILFPNGHCTYLLLKINTHFKGFKKSCFIKSSLIRTLQKMEKFDKRGGDKAVLTMVEL